MSLRESRIVKATTTLTALPVRLTRAQQQVHPRQLVLRRLQQQQRRSFHIVIRNSTPTKLSHTLPLPTDPGWRVDCCSHESSTVP